MFEEKIGNEYIVIQEGTSEGTQIKCRCGRGRKMVRTRNRFFREKGFVISIRKI